MDRAATHLEALCWAVASTTGPVLELGGGEYSTQVLAGFARAGREVWCVEGNSPWADNLRRRWGEFVHVVDEAPDMDWAVVLVDQWPPEDRAVTVGRYRDQGAVIVVHDTEPESSPAYPGLADAVAGGRTFSALTPWTTVLVP